MQEMAQMQVGYAIVVIACEQGSHGDDILGIVVLDGLTSSLRHPRNTNHPFFSAIMHKNELFLV